jgi:CDP-diacylglycerol--glycerol-3-phosphate 3-phosphatidyltransferase
VGIGQRAARIGISANALTYTSLVLSVAAGVAAAGGHFVSAAVLMLVGGAFDALDGVVARATGTVTRWGALLDSTVDRLADASPLLGVAMFYSDQRLLALLPVLAMVGGFTVSYVRARAEGLGVVLPSLFMRRAERVVLTAFSLFAGAVVLSAPVQAPLLLLGVSLLAVLNAIGAVVALRVARRALLNDERASAR